MQPHKFLISGGGTGGHIFPAIAIANEIRTLQTNSIIEFVGAKDKMEMEKVPAAGFKIHGIWIAGLQRKLTVTNLLFPIKLVSSLYSCFKILKKFKPDVVIGTGGFASGPLLKVACWLKIPTLIQEQNSYAGVTNKLLGKKVDKICLGFAKAKDFFPSEKCVVTGNPIRQSILNLPEKVQSLKELNLDYNKKTILIVGGSLGARTINETIDSLIHKFTAENIQIIWQTGKNYQATHQPEFGIVTQFIEKMEVVYACADIIISRAGAIAITELCNVGKPIILIPSPNVAEDHQTKNALALVEENAAILVKDKEAKTMLWDAIELLIKDDAFCVELAHNCSAIAKPRAASDIAGEVIKLIRKK